ncbi:MAG TPA: 16S rRNA (cytosine(967)-C(5))-methyltransferase RsmB [Myxococcales bacterium]|nr:16S rRNA (cytosine(967)-C(5))-methyltransferase RsmB [Myxococcales bacterium]
MGATPARRIAAEVLMRVSQGGAFANLALDAALRQAGALEPREAALATELSYGVLRWQIELDRAIAAHSDRKPDELDPPVQVALRVGAYELLHHPSVPARAAVNEGVELCKELKATRATGFVNAVLRRLSETRAAPPPPPREADPEGHVAASTSHPRWMVERWARWLGLEETEKLCRANQQQAPAVVRLKRGAREQALAALAPWQPQPGRYSPDAAVLGAGAPPALDIEGHEQGLFQAQDEAAQLVTLFAAPRADDRVLDACAAPGGKACHLAELSASVLAVDLHARKARQVAEAAQRMGLGNLDSRAADATLPLPGVAESSFDLVLLDAPCSGLGTLRRHPEVKLRRTPADVDRLAQLQAKLLSSVARYVKPGGLLVYALCTLTPEECDEQVARFTKSASQFHVEPPPPGFPADCLAGDFLRTLPHRTGTDGFFAARLRRT